MAISKDSLVLYKNRPALIKRAEDKLTIALESGKSVKVRPKDVLLLHPGPLQSLGQLQPQMGEVTVAWELLAGETTTLKELAELVYETFTPATAWAAWPGCAPIPRTAGSKPETSSHSYTTSSFPPTILVFTSRCWLCRRCFSMGDSR